MRKQAVHKERGVALLMALFALMLLTGVAFTMLYLSDTETSINQNYRSEERRVGKECRL